MFASNKPLIFSIRLMLVSSLLCVSYSQAQQESEKVDSTEHRRIERLGEGSTDEWEMDLRMPSAAPSISQGVNDVVLPDVQQNQELQRLLSKLAENPGNNAVLAELNTLLADVLVQVNALMDTGSSTEAELLLPLIQSINPGLEGLSAAKNRLQSMQEADELIAAAEQALNSGRVLEPKNSSAFYFYSAALEKDPQSRAAQKGLETVQNKLIERALEFARELDFETSDVWLQEASTIRGDQKPVEDARREVSEFKRERAVELEQKVMEAMNSGSFDLADFGIIDLMALGGQENQVKALLERLQEARVYGGFEPGQVISDELKSGGTAPEIVVIGAGSYLMGSQGRSDDTNDHEEPLHRVIIKRGFGLGVREVTIAEFELFIKSTGYRTAAELNGHSFIYDEAAGRLSKRDGIYWKHDYRGKEALTVMPVLHVNAFDAQAYVQWLSLETGKAYRLPSEAEYEYVAKAGGGGTYW